MIVLKNHHGNKPTIIIAGRVINGCVEVLINDLSVSDIDDICGRCEVSDKTREQVLALVATNTDDNINDFLKHPNEHVREMVARHGNDSHRDQLVNDPNEHVREMVAKYKTNN